jgi:4a-hydroxytetrahydrobiopterin dehydratase
MGAMETELRRLSDDEVTAALGELDGWRVLNGRFQREFTFGTFPDAIGFIVQSAIWADTWDHHPDWSNVYNRVRVELWTHDVGGLSALDVQLALKMNELAAQG